MNLGTPEGCREEALRQARLAQEFARIDCKRTVAKHEARAKELRLLALKLEADEADPLPF